MLQVPLKLTPEDRQQVKNAFLMYRDIEVAEMELDHVLLKKLCEDPTVKQAIKTVSHHLAKEARIEVA